MKTNVFLHQLLLCILLICLFSAVAVAWPAAEFPEMTGIGECAACSPVSTTSSSAAEQAIVPILMAAATGSDRFLIPETIRVTGIGLPPAGVTNPTVIRELTERSALSDAERKMVQSIAEIKAGSDQMRSRMADGTFMRRIEGFINGYRVVDKREQEDGKIEIDIELPLTGEHGSSRLLIE